MGHKNVELAQEVYDKSQPCGHPQRAQLGGQAVATKYVCAVKWAKLLQNVLQNAAKSVFVEQELCGNPHVY
jgi:hypothetical protein